MIELLEHMNGVHSKKSIPRENPECATCPFCNLKSKNLDELKTHFEKNHTSNHSNEDKKNDSKDSSNCSKCSFSGPTSELEKHVKSKHERHHVCEECGNTFLDRDELGVHIQDKHEKAPCSEPFPCERCGLVLATFNLLQDHVNNHHPPGKVNCQYCDFCGGDEKILKCHVMETHNDVVLLHTMARQVEDLADDLTQFEHFKAELSNTLKLLFANQNKIQQELFLIRNNLETSSSKPQTKCCESVPEDKEINSGPPYPPPISVSPTLQPTAKSSGSSLSTSTPSRSSSKMGPATRPTTRPPPPPAKAAPRVPTPLTQNYCE